MKIKLTQPGYESLTGMFGSLHFTDGLSDLEVSSETVTYITSVVQCDIVTSDEVATPAEAAPEPVEHVAEVAPVEQVED